MTWRPRSLARANDTEPPTGPRTVADFEGDTPFSEFVVNGSWGPTTDPANVTHGSQAAEYTGSGATGILLNVGATGSETIEQDKTYRFDVRETTGDGSYASLWFFVQPDTTGDDDKSCYYIEYDTPGTEFLKIRRYDGGEQIYSDNEGYNISDSQAPRSIEVTPGSDNVITARLLDSDGSEIVMNTRDVSGEATIYTEGGYAFSSFGPAAIDWLREA